MLQLFLYSLGGCDPILMVDPVEEFLPVDPKPEEFEVIGANGW